MNHHFKKTNLLAILLMLSFVAGAQTRTLSGKIVSAQNGNPVSKATIIATQNAKTFIADDNGNFSVTLPNGKNNLGLAL